MSLLAFFRNAAVVAGVSLPLALGYTEALARDCRDLYADLKRIRSNLPGKSFASPFAERAESLYALPEAAPRPDATRDFTAKKSFLRRYHSVFRGITSSDNKEFIALAERANAGLETPVKRSAIIQNAVAKQLNDVIVKNKDAVNELLNLQKDLLWSRISADPLLSRHLIGKYSDFNTIKLLFNSDSPELDRRLIEIFREYNARYSTFLDGLAKSEGWDQVAVGNARRRENWHVLGLGGSPDQANLAGRKARELLDPDGVTQPRTYEEIQRAVLKDIETTDRLRAILSRRFGNQPGMFTEGGESERVLSAEASETIRKAPQTDEAVKAALEARFRVKLKDSEVRAFRMYVAKADSFSPDLYVAERVEIPLHARRNGAVSADFKGQNARNLEGTMKFLAATRARPLEEQLRAIRAGEKQATEVLDAKKESFRRAVEKIFGKVDPNYRDFVYFTGDDGIYLPAAKITPEQKIAFARELGKKPDDLRLTFNWSHYADTGAEIPAEKLSEYIVSAEKVEKDLRKEMIQHFPREVLNQSQIVVDMKPFSDGAKTVGVYLGGSHSPEKMRELRNWTENYFRGKPYQLDFVETLPGAEAVPEHPQAAWAAGKSRVSALKPRDSAVKLVGEVKITPLNGGKVETLFFRRNHHEFPFPGHPDFRVDLTEMGPGHKIQGPDGRSWEFGGIDERGKVTYSSAGEQLSWQSGYYPGHRYVADLPAANKQVTLVIPALAGGAPDTITLARIREILGNLPAKGVENLDTVQVHSYQHRDDLAYAKRYERKGFDFHSTATAGKRKINLFPAGNHEEMLGTFRHELGHLVAEGIYGSVVPDERWLKAMQIDGRQVSAYAKMNYAEDFAETMLEYLRKDAGLNDPTLFKPSHQKFAARFQILDEYFGLHPQEKRRVADIYRNALRIGVGGTGAALLYLGAPAAWGLYEAPASVNQGQWGTFRGPKKIDD